MLSIKNVIKKHNVWIMDVSRSLGQVIIHIFFFFLYIRKSHQTELFTTIFSFLPGDFIARVDPDKKDCCIVDIYCSNIIYTPLQWFKYTLHRNDSAAWVAPLGLRLYNMRESQFNYHLTKDRSIGFYKGRAFFHFCLFFVCIKIDSKIIK